MHRKATATPTEVITIKQVPHDLKEFWNNRAKLNSRSINKEIIRLLEDERSRLLESTPVIKDKKRIREVIREMHSLPIIDDRPMDEILYDADGMPK